MIPAIPVRRNWTDKLPKLPCKCLSFIYKPQNIFLLFSGLAGGIILSSLSGCSQKPNSVTLSTGTVGSYYHRLGEQINYSTTTTVGLSVRNIDSQGSQENLQRLLNHQVDFAIAQLDVANEAMRQGKVKAVAILAKEYVHIIVRKNSGINTFDDLQGKRVAVGTPGSGILFTARQLIQTDKLKVKEDTSNFDEAFKKLKSRQLDAIIYVGSLGANENLRQIFVKNSNLSLLPIRTALINNLTVLDPSSYESATLPLGTYASRPPIPNRKLPTLSTATVLVTRPDMNRRTVGLVTWSILSTARTYAQFYPEIQSSKAEELMRKELFYIHPAAEAVFDHGDPRTVIIRYWENNNDLQAGVFILVTTSVIGLLLRQWHRQKSKKIITTTNNRISELKSLLPDHPQQALESIEDLSQENRLTFIEGLVSTEVYEQLRHKTQTFADQCRTLIEQQRKKFVMDTLLLLDEWQASLQTDPETALQKLKQIKQQYRDMLLSDQVDIEAYVELMNLTLISLMTLAPKSSPVHSDSENKKQNISN
ncbi:TAXI family TRAP transporter solute-binding subunit [Fischerella thermalis]|uniref:TAXI family TRAP transporter solute-binding subunit n=1 Tax=Fischerella thermalis TaxID=372787 RepID=UPI001A09CB56|nr:TAXI family TRAP transporter solute-binding subunit [Fischerella thermalis]MBF1990297.1 TAXI family TRAP transporter solute-binding subunit [Fischerella thermalis M58_A2018_009]MBF2060091.1 TAXI family TRAP transporter solute-binding subunit [Fischerella thermalis M66_A2018_004]MBF2069312.1 TAXI family TRAP transporter solute-binding subunit [Fischerella thermalis M48_A2018_028]